MVRCPSDPEEGVAVVETTVVETAVVQAVVVMAAIDKIVVREDPQG